MARTTGLELVEFIEDYLSLETTDASSEPTRSMLIRWINIAQRETAVELKPKRLLSTATDVATVKGVNSADIPSTFLMTNTLYSKDAGSYKRLEAKPIESITDPTTLFLGTSAGTPSYYEERGGSYIFDTVFNSTSSDGLQAFGLLAPTDVDNSDLSPQIDFSKEYDMILVLKVSALFYQKDGDSKNLQVVRTLEKEEKDKLRSHFNVLPSSMSLDPKFFRTRRI